MATNKNAKKRLSGKSSGPSKTLTTILLNRGSQRGKKRINDGEIQPDLANAPCPHWLSFIGKTKWRELYGKLKGIGVLTELDTDALATYCFWYSKFRELVRDKEDVNALAKATSEMSKAGANFGLNPIARISLRVINKEKDDRNGKLKYFSKAQKVS